MPLLGKKSYKPSPFPKDLKPEEEVFVIKETNEVFRSYDEYVNRIILYGFQVWSCQLTGKTNLKYAEAVACEEQALKRLESFPKYFEKPILQIVHHSSSGLQTLAQQCYKLLENEYFENEPVECCVSGQWHKGKISKVHHESIASSDSKNISSTSISPSSDKENSIVEKPQSLIEKNSGFQYDITCESIPDGPKGIVPGDIKRLKKLPSVELLKCFIRAKTENPWSNDNSPWLVKTELARKYSLTDKLKDFTLIFNKKTTPKSKTPAKRTKSTEKPKKKFLDEGAGHSKPKVNKVDPSQRKLDAFRKSTTDVSKTTDKTTTSSVKLTQNALKKHTPVVKDLVEGSSSLEENDDKTPSGQLRGTPIKCRLVLTPVKAPYKETGKSPAQTISGIKGAANKSKTNCVVIEDDTIDVTTISCKTPKKSLCKSVNKLKKSPKGSKPKRASELAEAKRNDKLLKDAAPSKSIETMVIDGDIKKKDLCIKKAESEKKAKTPKADTVRRTELVNLADESEDDFVSCPKKLKVHVTPVSVKQSASKMKQMTLLDLTKKTDDEKAAPSSPKIKAKKQKTLSEMFSAALQKDKPSALNALIRKTAKEVSSPSNLVLNLPAQQCNQVTEKWHALQERLKWKTMSAEEKAKNRLERRKLPRQLNEKPVAKKKPEDHELLNLTPLPPAKPVNHLTGISPESFSDVAMIAEFVHTFRDLLVPKETLHISIDNLSEALVAGVKGFALLSRILVIFLQILLQDSSTKGKDVGMQLSEMPLTQQTASEVSRLYLSSKLKILTAYEDDKQLQGILESLQHDELYSLTADEKIKILVILCHEVLSSDALDDYMGSQFAAATELRKEKMVKLKEKKDQQKEENERLKREKEGLQKQKENEESKKQLKMDDLNKKGETESSHTNSEAAASVSTASEKSSKNGEQKATKETTKDAGTNKDAEEVSEVVKAMRKRREDMANKEERKMKEEKDRLEKEKEEQWNINMAHCQYTKRLEPLGYDRNHARYWVFNGIAVGVYVEQGWRNLEDLSQTFDKSSKEVAMETDGNEQAPFADDVKIVGETKDERKMDAYKKDDVQELRLPDIPYSWSCYGTVEEVQLLFECLSHQGIRESALKKALKEQMESITEGIRRNSYRKPAKLETEEEGFLNSMKEELKDIAERLVHGNLAILGDGLERYQEAVDNSSSVGDLTSQLEKLLPSVLPQFYQGMFSKDKANSEKAKECWLEEVKKATTASRLHLLLGILDSAVIWDLSAENAQCKICRIKGVGEILILCDDCNLGYHLQCLRPALSEVPEGHWSCPVCKPNERLSSRTSSKNYKEGSSSEDQDEEASEATLGDSEDSSLEDETDEHEDYCHTCGEDGDLICCDMCPLVFHTVCHQPPLRNIPRGAWSCWQCRQPKDKKQKKNLQGGHTSKSKTAKKRARQDESSRRTSKRKRSRSLSSEDSGHQESSKRTRQRRQPMEITDDDSARGRRRRAPASIEDLSDDESFVGKRKASKSKQRGGKQGVSRNGSVVSRLRRRYPQDSEDEKEQSPDSNVKSFYGRSTRRTCQRKTSNDSNTSDDDDDEEEEEEPVTQRKRTTRAARHPERGSRRNRHPILGDSEDEDEDNETEEKESRKTSLRKKSGTSNSARRSTRNQRRVSSSSEPSEDDDEGVSQSTNQRVSGNKRNAKQVLSSSDESGLNMSKGSSPKSRTLRDRFPEPNKSRRGNVKRQTQGRGGNRHRLEEGWQSDDGNGKNNGGKQKKAVLKNSSITKDSKTQTRNGLRAEVSQEDKKEKRRRVNVEMDACEQILRDLILYEDSWPFTQAVNLREVPDYLELVKTPMDLGTIRDKLKNLEYPDVESFVADVRLVFSNSDKYNLDTSEVGKAGKNLEKYFNKLFKQIFSNSNNKSKVQRKR